MCKARGRTKLKMMHNAYIENWEHAHNMTHDDVTSCTTAFRSHCSAGTYNT